MASRDKKAPATVGRKQTIASPTPQPPAAKDGEEKGADEKRFIAKKEPIVTRKTLRSLTLKAKTKKSARITKSKRALPAKKATLIKNGIATSASVIRKRPLSLRERINPTQKAAKKDEVKIQIKVKKEAPDSDEPREQEVQTKTKSTTSKRMKKGKESEISSPIQNAEAEIVIKKEPEDELMQTDDDIKVHHRLPRVAKKSRALDKVASEGDIKKKIRKDSPDVLKNVDMSDSSVIDKLDLNVNRALMQDNKVTKGTLTRRHSISRYPIAIQDYKVMDDSAIITNAPKSKRRPGRPIGGSCTELAKARASARNKLEPRILRNGKNRRHQQQPLFDGLDSEYKMRRRLASDFSGSEISKLSGYESDSSLSSSIQETVETDKEKELLLKKELLETLENNPPDTAEGKQIVENFSAAIKRSLSMDTANETPPALQEETDTNSNLCVKSEDPTNPDFAADVPKLLGIMKEVFNNKGVTIVEEGGDADRRKTRSSIKRSPSLDKEATQQLSATTISTLSAVGISLGPEITVTAEQVGPQEIPPESDQNPTDAEPELVDILKNKPEQAESSTPPASMNGGSPSESTSKNSTGTPEGETPESLAEKSQILKALGLQTLQEAEEARKKQVPKENYTGTLKTVIKLNRCNDKKKQGRNPIKMTLQKKGKHKDDDDRIDEDEYKIMKESSSWKHQGGQSSESAGALRKSHYSNRSNMDGSSEHTSDGDTPSQEEGGSGKLLVIPEKASSFSIHPGRLCKDECTYCFGKFGLFDTPCHIAQIKSVERQDKILANEKHLTRDSCLCDACYRHVDRKANISSYASNKSLKRNALIAPAPRENHCHVLGCNNIASNILKRKWLIKMRKAVCQVINIDLDNPGMHSIPICKDHYSAVEHLMVCAMCKRKLARNHIHYLDTESNGLQRVLNNMKIPVKLSEKPVVCKLCRYFATNVLKKSEENDENASDFVSNYRKRLWQFHNVEPMEETVSDHPILTPLKDEVKQEMNSKKRKRDRRSHNNDPPVLEPEVELHTTTSNGEQHEVNESRSNSPSDYMVDYQTLIPNVAIECVNDSNESSRLEKQTASLSIRRITKAEAQEKKRMCSEMAVQSLGMNPSISIRQMFPGEEDVPLNAHIEFNKIKERTPEGWEKCTSTIQYDQDTKQLWHELQKPYGNQSSFLRHLILLEKYFRNGDLILSQRASNQSSNYTESVQNRLKSYDNISSSAGQVQPTSMLPFNNPKLSFNAVADNSMEVDNKECDKTFDKVDKAQTALYPLAMSTPNMINQAQLPKNTPLTLLDAKAIVNQSSMASESNVITAGMPPLTAIAAQTPGISMPKAKPPGLISLQPTSKLPATITAAPATKPQSQKIKFPITKNWRPKLIPIDPSCKPEKKPGLVQVISGGKPYHITIEDYKKMCAIKRTYDLRQKRLQETLRNQTLTAPPSNNPNSLLKNVSRRPKSPSNSDLDQEENLTPSDGTNRNDLKIKFTNTNTQLGSQQLQTVEGKIPIMMPKIPKSLTVIPQTVTISKNNSRPNTPENYKNSHKAKS